MRERTPRRTGQLNLTTKSKPRATAASTTGHRNSPLLKSSSASLRLSGEKCLRRLPPLAGQPIRLETDPNLRDRRGAVHAGAFLRERRIAFNCTRAEFPRIFVHELFHFIWLRAGNPLRHSWEALLQAELTSRARGELGWSAEWRKTALHAADSAGRTRRWREYACESFCDTAAWLYSGVQRHTEFTLAARFRARRREWFHQFVGNREVPV